MSDRDFSCQVPPGCSSGVVGAAGQCCDSGVVDVAGGCCPAGAQLDAAGACCAAGKALDATGSCGGTAQLRLNVKHVSAACRHGARAWTTRAALAPGAAGAAAVRRGRRLLCRRRLVAGAHCTPPRPRSMRWTAPTRPAARWRRCTSAAASSSSPPARPGRACRPGADGALLLPARPPALDLGQAGAHATWQAGCRVTPACFSANSAGIGPSPRRRETPMQVTPAVKTILDNYGERQSRHQGQPRPHL